jgi:hypothetical protein
LKRAVLLLSALVACRQIVGIEHVELAEGGTTPEGGADGGGMPSQVFTRGNEPIVKILTDGQYVYALLSSSILRCKVTGCGTTPETIVAPVASGIIDDMALDARLYYSLEGMTATLPDGGMPPANDGSIHVVDKNGMNDQVFLGMLAAPNQMVISGDLYWFDDQGTIAADNPVNSVRRCPLTGGCGKGIAVIDSLGSPGVQMAADSKFIYLMTSNKLLTADEIDACGLGQACGTMARLAIGNIDNTAQNSIATDANYVYFAGNVKGDIVRVDAMNTVKNLVGGEVAPSGIAADGKYVYWGSSQGNIRRVGIDGGMAQTIASNQANPNHLVTDAANIYFVVESGQGSSVMSLPKPP